MWLCRVLQRRKTIEIQVYEFCAENIRVKKYVCAEFLCALFVRRRLYNNCCLSLEMLYISNKDFFGVKLPWCFFYLYKIQLGLNCWSTYHFIKSSYRWHRLHWNVKSFFAALKTHSRTAYFHIRLIHPIFEAWSFRCDLLSYVTQHVYRSRFALPFCRGDSHVESGLCFMYHDFRFCIHIGGRIIRYFGHSIWSMRCTFRKISYAAFYARIGVRAFRVCAQGLVCHCGP